MQDVDSGWLEVNGKSDGETNVHFGYLARLIELVFVIITTNKYNIL
jgi:hypothetical protein